MSGFRLNQLLDKFKADGVLSHDQARVLSDLSAGSPFSLYRELRAALYLGVLFLLGGVGLTIKAHFAQIGHVAIIVPLTLGFLGLFAYCFIKAPPYSSTEVTSPHMAFDYLLYLACTIYSLDIGYVETHFHLLGPHWDSYLLVSSVLFLVFAYWFDNRLVLALALGTLATWFGFKLDDFDLAFRERYRFSAILYGLIVGGVGVLLAGRSIKAHFLDVYLNFAAHFYLERWLPERSPIKDFRRIFLPSCFSARRRDFMRCGAAGLSIWPTPFFMVMRDFVP